jgi:flagellar biogenesis protein FliO
MAKKKNSKKTVGAVKRSSRTQTLSPVMQLGVAFIFIAAIILFAFVVKRYI